MLPPPLFSRLTAPRALASCALILAAMVVAGCGSGSSAEAQTGASKPHFAGAEASPPQPAAPLRLRNYLGEPVSISQYKGKAVLVTFIYTHCPDTCPLIVSHVKTALSLLGPKARDVQVIAVSTDPRGDNRKTVTSFVDEHGMKGRMKYLIGSKAELGQVWKDWNIVAKPAKAGRDLVEHSALIYGIGADGKVTTLYAANFKPAELVHDVPLLAEA
ncbi:MAG: SCO family protein [Solirubrobacterales bacterium]